MSATFSRRRRDARPFRGARLRGPLWPSAVFVVSAVVLFGLLYWLTSGYLIHEVDERLNGEINEFSALSGPSAIESIAALSRRDIASSRPYGLFDTHGTWLAGNIHALPSPRMKEPFDYEALPMPNATALRHYRGIVVPTASGLRVVVGHDIEGILAFDETLVRTLCIGLAIATLLSSSLFLAMNRLTNRRLREIRDSADSIMSGDLSGRLPSDGSDRDLDRLVGIVNRMLEEIEHLMAEVQGVCAGIAHDLRTPMARLRAGLERARRRGGAPDDYDAALHQAIAEADGMMERFTALLRIAQVEANGRRAQFAAVRLDSLIRDLVDLYEPLAELRGIALVIDATERDGDAGEVIVEGDVDLLFGAVENLLDNALKYTQPKGVVRMGAHRRTIDGKRCAVLSVTDNGPGIPAVERQAVLRPFYRCTNQINVSAACDDADGCDRATPMEAGVGSGHGVGLSLVAAIARTHGATLEIGSAAPGCRIELRFPPVDAVTAAAAKAPVATTVSATLHAAP